MDINIKKRSQGEIIGDGDLVISNITSEESVIMLVVKNPNFDYNVVVFDGKIDGETKVFINHYYSISQEELQQNYKLVAKAEDVKITIEY